MLWSIEWILSNKLYFLYKIWVLILYPICLILCNYWYNLMPEKRNMWYTCPEWSSNWRSCLVRRWMQNAMVDVDEDTFLFKISNFHIYESWSLKLYRKPVFFHNLVFCLNLNKTDFRKILSIHYNYVTGNYCTFFLLLAASLYI